MTKIWFFHFLCSNEHPDLVYYDTLMIIDAIFLKVLGSAVDVVVRGRSSKKTGAKNRGGSLQKVRY